MQPQWPEGAKGVGSTRWDQRREQRIDSESQPRAVRLVGVRPVGPPNRGFASTSSPGPTGDAMTSVVASAGTLTARRADRRTVSGQIVVATGPDQVDRKANTVTGSESTAIATSASLRRCATRSTNPEPPTVAVA